MEQAVTPSTPAVEQTTTTEVADGSSEGQEQTGIEASDDGGEVSHETKEAKEQAKFKRKVNGKLIEATEDELWKHYGLEVTAKERMQQAAAQRKEADEIRKGADSDKAQIQEFFNSIQDNPRLAFELLGKMGHDAKKIARELVLEELEYERLSPAEKRATQLERENAEYKRKLEEREVSEKEQARVASTQKFINDLDDTLASALKLSGLSPKPKTVARLAEACQTLLNASKSDTLPSPQEIVDKFLTQSRSDASELLKEQDVEKLIELGFLNDNLISEIVKRHYKKTEKNLPSFSAGSNATTQAKKESSKKQVGVNQFFAKLGR